MKLNFKKISILMICLVLSLVSFAQDRIIKKDKSEIKAKIIEISDNEIKYKKEDNSDGPTYSIKKAEVTIIIYKNGQVETFSNETPVETKPEESVPVVQKTNKTVNTSNNSNIQHKYVRADFKGGKVLFFDSDNNITRVNKFKAVKEIMQPYSSLQSDINGVQTFKYVALGLNAIGVGFLLWDQVDYWRTPSSLRQYLPTIRGKQVLWLVFEAAGLGVTYGLTQPKFKKLIKNYNGIVGNNTTKHKPTLNFQVSENGVGLALHF